MSNYQTYAQREFEIDPQYHDIKHTVFDILEVISREGHSGGSMGFFSGMLEHWSQEPIEHKEKDSLTNPIFKLIKDFDKEAQKRILEVVRKLMTYTPLSPLTGEPEEWVYQGGGLFQNNRMPSIFMEEGKAYWIDAVVYYEPTQYYIDWIGFTGSFSRKFIEFPFDPNTPREEVFWTSEERTEQINNNPRLWLKNKREELRICLNLTNAFVKTESVAKEVIEKVKQFYRMNTQLPIYKLNWFIDDCQGIDESDYYQATFGNDKDLKGIGSPITFTCRNTFLNWLRIVSIIGLYESVSYRDIDKYLLVFKTKEPTRHYQDWKHSDKLHICYDTKLFLKTFNTDEDGYLYLDPSPRSVQIVDVKYKNQYLYKKCKELGLEYKGIKD